jgi:hypothetical protein
VQSSERENRHTLHDSRTRVKSGFRNLVYCYLRSTPVTANRLQTKIAANATANIPSASCLMNSRSRSSDIAGLGGRTV